MWEITPKRPRCSRTGLGLTLHLARRTSLTLLFLYNHRFNPWASFNTIYNLTLSSRHALFVRRELSPALLVLGFPNLTLNVEGR